MAEDLVSNIFLQELKDIKLGETEQEEFQNQIRQLRFQLLPFEILILYKAINAP
jgi:hypothetical protein